MKSHHLAVALLLVAARASAVNCPNIMLVLDQSGSMTEDPQTGRTPVAPAKSKWDIMKTAVINLVTKYGDQVPFGLELYTSAGFDIDECYADTKIDVQPAHETAQKIIDKIKAARPESGTNTGEAIKRARLAPAMADKSRAQYIILVTDGDPNCHDDDLAGMAAYTISEIKKAAAQSPTVHTFVVGFDGSGGVSPDNLNAMAKAGLEPRMGCTAKVGNQCYYSASKAQELEGALDKIINQVTGGEFGMTSCDDSCYASGCPMGEICVVDELNPKPHCAPNPCAGVGMCAEGEYCRQGACVKACPQCRTGEKCVDGQCIADPCAGSTCSDGAICNPFTGQCMANPCVDKKCQGQLQCDPVTGGCVPNQCLLITCPTGTTCLAPGGHCVATMGAMMPGGGKSGSGQRGAGGCVSIAGGTGGGGGALLALALLVALFRRRRG